MYSFYQLLAATGIGLFLGGLFTGAIFWATREQHIKSYIQGLDVSTRKSVKDLQTLVIDDGNSLRKLFGDNQQIYDRALELMAERNKLIVEGIPEVQPSKTAILFDRSRQLAINTLRNILVIDMGDDSATLSTIKLLVKEAVDSISTMDKEIEKSA